MGGTVTWDPFGEVAEVDDGLTDRADGEGRHRARPADGPAARRRERQAQPAQGAGDARNGMGRNRPSGGLFLRRLDLFGVIAEIRAPRALARALGVVLRAYPTAPAGAEPDIRIAVTREARMWRVAANRLDDKATHGETAKAGIAAGHVEWLVVSEALKRWNRFVHVHAALVASSNRSALLIGRSGSGKSTTSVALALAGYALYSDDLVLIDRATLRPLCFPRPVKLDKRSRRLLAPRGLVVPGGASLGESIDRTALPGLPPLEAPGPPVTAVIFFAGERRDHAEVRRLTQAEAVMRLIQQSVSERLDANGPSEGAMALISAAPCYELVPGDLDSTVQAVVDLLAAPVDSLLAPRGGSRPRSPNGEPARADARGAADA